MNMLTKNIDAMTAKIDAHRAADLLVQGSYFNLATGKGCFIGCLAHGNNPTLLAEEYGIPVPLTRLLENVFERLPATEAAEFFSAIPRAIGRDKKDLSRVVWHFLAAELRALPPQPPNIQAVIDPVIAGMDLLASGQTWPEAAAAARAARAAAARAAARAAAARAAAWAAEAARAAAWAWAAAAEAAAAAAEAAARKTVRLRQRDTLLQLMADAA
jgi:hypothetical protein